MKEQNNDYVSSYAASLAHADITTKSDVRWWMAAGMHTDETLREEVRAMYEAGFSGVELCQLADRTIDETVYGYGGAQWENDVKLILNTALDLGMSVSLTSGAGWSTANVPGLDPDCQAANQCVVLFKEDIGAGSYRSGAIPTSEKLREKAAFLGAVAVKKAGDTVYHPDGYVVLTDRVTDGTLGWQAPTDGDYTIMYYYVQGTAHRVSPAVRDSYTINYFDRRGVEALKQYLNENVLNDETLNQKIKAGDVQYFMDSLEYHEGAGITVWTETFAEEFRRRKGYDILPYLFLAEHAPSTSIWGWSDNADLIGTNTLTDPAQTKRILNDIYDVQTKLYLEQFIAPFRAWLNERGITLRAQISYGKNLEISEPIWAVDKPETENRNQKNQPDLYRLWSGGAHLQNKVLSAETGGLDNSNYNYTYQRHLQEAYHLYAAGCARIIWHIWSSQYGPKPVWPGYEGGDGMQQFYKFGLREPSYDGYAAFNAHLGRIQKFLRTGKPAIDVGMSYIKYGQHLVYADRRDWLCEHEPMFFPSMTLQDNGYTYDYFNPALLKADGVTYNRETRTIEPAGYRALVLWQNELSLCGAETIAELAKAGMPLVIVDGAASYSPYYGECDDTLADLTAQMKTLANVRVVPTADDVLPALKALGITPYTAFATPNRCLLTQTRRDGDNRLIYVYNYAGTPFPADRDCFTTEFTVDGCYLPCKIDAWTGKATPINAFRNDGKTVFSVSLAAGDVALYCLEPVKDDRIIPTVPTVKTMTPYDITDWNLTVESWTPSEELLSRTETLLGITTTEYAYQTEKREIHVTLPTLTTWDNIPCIGKTVCGKGIYSATFSWDGTHDGAYLDFGRITQSLHVKINGIETAPINLNVPRADITDLLRIGENSIEIVYSSNLNNLQISRGMIKEGILVNNFPGYVTKYESYGIAQAIVVPYDKV